jgi:hypothetical protein
MIDARSEARGVNLILKKALRRSISVKSLYLEHLLKKSRIFLMGWFNGFI